MSYNHLFTLLPIFIRQHHHNVMMTRLILTEFATKFNNKYPFAVNFSKKVAK